MNYQKCKGGSYDIFQDLKEQSNYNARWEFISRLDCSSTLVSNLISF